MNIIRVNEEQGRERKRLCDCWKFYEEQQKGRMKGTKTSCGLCESLKRWGSWVQTRRDEFGHAAPTKVNESQLLFFLQSKIQALTQRRASIKDFDARICLVKDNARRNIDAPRTSRETMGSSAFYEDRLPLFCSFLFFFIDSLFQWDCKRVIHRWIKGKRLSRFSLTIFCLDVRNIRFCVFVCAIKTIIHLSREKEARYNFENNLKDSPAAH